MTKEKKKLLLSNRNFIYFLRFLWFKCATAVQYVLFSFVICIQYILNLTDKNEGLRRTGTKYVLCFEGTNPCARSNGGCQQLCFHLGSGRRTCSCAHGRLADDGFACERYEGYLLYSERTILKSIHLSDESDLNSPVQPFENPSFFKNVIALAFDYSQSTAGTNRIFFSDIHFGNIQVITDDWTERFIIAESKYI